MTNPDSVLKRDISLPANVPIVKSVGFPVVAYGCERWTIKKAECRRIDDFEFWCWRSRPWDFPGKSTGVGCHCLLRLELSKYYSLKDFCDFSPVLGCFLDLPFPRFIPSFGSFYLLISGWAGSSLLCRLFLWVRRVGAAL